MRYIVGHNWRGRKRSPEWVAARSGETSPSWKGGRRFRKDGYVLRGDRLEHRVVMEERIGRPLKQVEVVHHIDGNPSNNEISNLLLFPDNGSHRRYHGGKEGYFGAISLV